MSKYVGTLTDNYKQGGGILKFHEFTISYLKSKYTESNM